MKITRLVPHAQLPTRTTGIGYDIYSAEGYVVQPGERVVISTGLKVSLPQGYYGTLFSKTGITIKHGVTVTGLLEPGYEGELKVVLFNFDRKSFVVRQGYRVAELVVAPCVTPDPVEIVPDN